MKLFPVLGLLTFAAVGLWLVPQSHADREVGGGGAIDHPIVGAVGTTGTHPEPTDEPAVIREIETITGTNDGMSLIGRRVELHVDVQGLANDHSFWVGSPDNRLLVVLVNHRSTHRIAPVHRGQRTAVSGVIKPIPDGHAIAGWNLTHADSQEVADRKIYIRADAVTTQNHGTM